MMKKLVIFAVVGAAAMAASFATVRAQGKTTWDGVYSKAQAAKGEAVYNDGQIIGFASKDIAPGDWVHVHNLGADAFERDYAFCQDCPPRTLATSCVKLLSDA